MCVCSDDIRDLAGFCTVLAKVYFVLGIEDYKVIGSKIVSVSQDDAFA